MAALGQRGGSEAPSSSVLQALTPGLPLALEDGSSDEEYYDAADKFTPPDALSGEPSLAGLWIVQAAPQSPGRAVCKPEGRTFG